MRHALLLLVVPLAAQADGIPADPLAYTGVMLGQNGVPITTPQLVTLTLWRSPTSTVITDRLCAPPGERLTPDPQGRFTAVVQSVCVDKVRATPEVWLEVGVNADVLSPRTKLRAVPFAVVAGRVNRTVLVGDAGVTSAMGLYCGTTSFTRGPTAGYRLAKKACEAACGASPTAHVCAGIELVRTMEVSDVAIPDGVTANGIFSSGGAAQGSTDCAGFKAITADTATGGWTNGSSPYQFGCGNTAQLLCCD